MKFKTRVLPYYTGGFGEKAYTLDLPPGLAFSFKEGIYYGEVKREKEIFHGLFYFGPVPTLGIKDKNLEFLVLDLGIEYIAPDDIIECELKEYFHEIREYDLVDYLARDTEIDKQTVITKYLYKE